MRGRPWLVVLEIEGGRQGEGLIHQASALPEEVLGELTAPLDWQREVTWDGERVSSREVKRLGALVLAARPAAAAPAEVTAVLLTVIQDEGLDLLNWTAAARQFAARVRFAAAACPEEDWPDLAPERLLTAAASWLAPFLEGARSRADLSRLDPLPALEALLGWRRRRRLDELAPTHLAVPSGSRIALDYQREDPPVLAVKLQELFGLGETPRVAAGRVPVLLHLLSPARRPIQVTRDLRSFWDGIYPEVKKELKGRYPKHPWPDDPWNAAPTRHLKKRG